jgi:glycosyltransferase involved in cell wall biosynthesis
MKIAVYFKAYRPDWESKDYAQIVMGLAELGIESELFTLDKPAFDNYIAPFAVRTISQEQASSSAFWRSTPYDVIIVYTYMDWSNIWMIDVMKNAGKKVIVKADTDGRKTFPVYPRKLMDCFYTTAADRTRVLYKRLKQRLMGGKRGMRIAEHVYRADAVVVESPQAQANISYILSYWCRPELIGKVFSVPNPVSSYFTSAPIPAKENIVVTSGAWQREFVKGSYQKNTFVTVNALCRFLQLNPDYKAVVIGSGEDLIKQTAEKWPSSNKILATGFIPNEEANQYLSKSKIFFQPSLIETFGIAAAEGLCMGCSFVGTPLESFQYLAQGGATGTLSESFTEDSCFAALMSDHLKWERNIYSPDKISSIWRPVVNREAIAKSYLQIAEHLR